MKYLLCHGSGNRFVLFDTLEEPQLWHSIDLPRLAQEVSRAFKSDGILLLVQNPEGYAMRMYNPDGSEAEMCGNGIRCVARLADERYLHQTDFTLYSGGNPYPCHREEALADGVATYGVEIAIRLSAQDFPLGGEQFLDKPIPELDPTLRFSYLNLGNPHLITRVEEIDYDLLERLARRASSLPTWFPRGINISLVRLDSPTQIFVATWERGVGITHSCGTAMTASTTAMTLSRKTPSDQEIRVRNRGGEVRCLCQIFPEGIKTRLVGNATFEASGTWIWNGRTGTYSDPPKPTGEQANYEAFIETLKNN